ncbi:MAG: hypothetical protein Q9175_002950 [Cornicularia normoerica]
MFRVSKPTENKRRKASKMTAKQKEVRHNQVVRACHAPQLPQTAATPILEPDIEPEPAVKAEYIHLAEKKRDGSPNYADGIKETVPAHMTANELTRVSLFFVAFVALLTAINILENPTAFAHYYIHPASETSYSRAGVLLAAYHVTILFSIHSTIVGVVFLQYIYTGSHLGPLLVGLFALVVNMVIRHFRWRDAFTVVAGLCGIYRILKQRKMEAANMVR